MHTRKLSHCPKTLCTHACYLKHSMAAVTEATPSATTAGGGFTGSSGFEAEEPVFFCSLRFSFFFWFFVIVAALAARGIHTNEGLNVHRSKIASILSYIHLSASWRGSHTLIYRPFA